MSQLQLQQLEQVKPNASSLILSDYVKISNVLSPGYLFMNVRDFNDVEQNVVHLLGYNTGMQKITVWAAYVKSEDRVYIDGGCKYEGGKFLEYDSRWIHRGFAPISSSSGNLISQYMRKYLAIDIREPNKEEYKLYLLYNIWYENQIDDNTFVKLFFDLDLESLRGDFRVDIRGNVDHNMTYILIGLYSMLHYKERLRRSIINTIQNYLDDMYKITHNGAKYHDLLLNVVGMNDNYKYNPEVIRISQLFENALATSKYTDPDYTGPINDCPLSVDECEFEPDDVESPCSVYSYGDTLFNFRDVRNYAAQLVYICNMCDLVVDIHYYDCNNRNERCIVLTITIYYCHNN